MLFVPIKDGEVSFYSCGPTVYDYVHIGNLRYFTFVDTLRRILEFTGYSVNHVMNITDVGHLSGDGDLGEDKMLRAVEREKAKQGKEFTVWDLAKFYTDAFLVDSQKMNFLAPQHLTKATDHIKGMIELIESLMSQGYAYKTRNAVYFDVTKFADYTKLSGQKLDEKTIGSRDEVVIDEEKHHPADFRLWQLDQPDHAMQWDSPWGKGFPGWHIECSAMAMEYLGKTIDIHTGGIDHIPVHHTNEIAQSEASTGEIFANYWLHVDFLRVNDEKMAKSKGNAYNLSDIIAKGYSPMNLRYFYLSAHYRTALNFTWEALEGAQSAYDNLWTQIMIAKTTSQKIKSEISVEDESELSKYLGEFTEAISDDLNTPLAVAVLWEVAKSNISPAAKVSFFEKTDSVMGLALLSVPTLYDDEFSDKATQTVIIEMVTQRDIAKSQKDYAKSDELRENILKMGYLVLDTTHGTIAIPQKTRNL